MNNASSTVAGVVNVSLNVSAGPPSITSIFPSSVIAAPSTGRVPPVITIYGDNFFPNSSVQLTPDGSQPLPALTPVLLSRQVLQATVNPVYLTKPGTFTLTVANPNTLTDPSPKQFSVPFTVTDGTVPEIDAIVNAASHSRSKTWKGTLGLDPVPTNLPGQFGRLAARDDHLVFWPKYRTGFGVPSAGFQCLPRHISFAGRSARGYRSLRCNL